MRAIFPPECWRRRRVLWPLAALLSLGGAGYQAMRRAGTSQVMVYNQTGGALGDLAISAAGQSRTFRRVDDGESVCFELAASGDGTEITLGVGGVLVWNGDFMEPGAGYRAVIHLRPGGQVESQFSLSWWNRWFFPSAVINQ